MFLKKNQVNNLKKICGTPSPPFAHPLTKPHGPQPVVRAVAFSHRNSIFSSKLELNESAWLLPRIFRVQDFLRTPKKHARGKYHCNDFFVT